MTLEYVLENYMGEINSPEELNEIAERLLNGGNDFES